MKMFRLRSAAGLLSAAAIFSLFPASAQDELDPQRVQELATGVLERHPQIQFHPAAVLVRFAPYTEAAYREQVRAMVGDGVLKTYEQEPGLELIHTRIGVQRAIQKLQGFVLYAEPDFVVHAINTPNDSLYSLCWGLNNTGQTVNNDPGIAGADINAPEAWNTFTGDANFKIAVIDTGTQYTHPDLAANIWSNPGEIAGNGIDDDSDGYVDDIRGWDFYSVDNNPDDTNGHGTHTAGTIGAVGNNGTGVVGVNWACKLVPLRFLGPSGGYTSDAILAVNYCTAKQIKVSNNSWGGGGFSQGLYDAINASKSVGHIFCAAAGNNGTNNDSSAFYPANYNLDNLISVAATDNNDGRASFSNYGATTVDLGAPGVNIASTYYGSQYVYLSGTSMATPHVTGAVALVEALNPGFTYLQVRNQILSTVRHAASMSGVTVTGGILDLAAAVGVPSGNTAPTVVISSPSNGAGFTQGSSISFTGSASDTQDGNLGASLVWTSSLQGQIGTGTSFSRSDLAVGTHVITASVTDSGSLTGFNTVTINVTSNSTPPAAPSNLTGTNLGGGQVQLHWNDNSSNEANFQIQRQRRNGGSWGSTVYFTAGANVTSFNDAPGTGRWRYRVRAQNGAGSSSWTGWLQFNL
ncbi:MAG: S8 family serine peptidase [Planctomycetes bacterium]|nr:S8 family serine peptidase [Planctomycetota bacterium]